MIVLCNDTTCRHNQSGECKREGICLEVSKVSEGTYLFECVHYEEGTRCANTAEE